MSMTFPIAIHLASALGALAIGPVALWARKGAKQRPRLHRAAGYAWVTLMIAAAVSALFIRYASPLPNIWGYTPIHLLVPATFWGLYKGFAALARGDIASHRKTMQGLYWGAGVTAGFFALLPQRFLGQVVWGSLGAFAQATPAWVYAAMGGLLAAIVIHLKWRKSDAAHA